MKRWSGDFDILKLVLQHLSISFCAHKLKDMIRQYIFWLKFVSGLGRSRQEWSSNPGVCHRWGRNELRCEVSWALDNFPTEPKGKLDQRAELKSETK